MALTTKEKADRYDALQMAIKFTLESYKRRQKAFDRQYEVGKDLGLIGAYSKGLSDSLCYVIEDLTRWNDCG